MKLFSVFQKNPENRTQFFIVMGFIILPILAMVYVFIDLVANDPSKGGGRLKIPPAIMKSMQQQNQQTQAPVQEQETRQD